ncbi:MAG TPA: efflux RND transporter permease subunit [Spirochaetia bacterium]|nr:efflux RND transporter permease subunit [Spirochaetia bacterium]
MNFYRSWIRRPVTVFMILAVLTAMTLVALMDVRIGPSTDRGRITYAVILNYYGVDAGRIERDIAVPLENAIAGIPGIDDLTSVSEYGKARVTVTLLPDADPNEVYLQLRDGVDRVYNRLPAAVQKPLIVSSSQEKRPVFIVTFRSDTIDRTKLNQLVEKEVKASYERIEGTGEIDVGGGEIKEIHVRVESDRAVQAGLSIPDIASLINSQDVLAPLGTLSTPLTKIPVVIKGRFASLDDLRHLLIAVPNAGPEQLAGLAEIGYGRRERESISRVNGQEQVIVYVESSGSANLVTLSRRLREETEHWKERGLVPDVILDTGKKVEDSIFGVMNAIVAGVILVVILLVMSSGNPRQILLLSLLVPAVCLMTAGLLSLLHISLDGYVLAGMAVGIGAIVDGAIVLTESCSSRRIFERFEHAYQSLAEIIPPLVSSVLTTIVVLVPLFFLSDIAEGIRSVTISVGLMMLIALFLTVIFIPPFLFFRQDNQALSTSRKRRFSFVSLRWLRRLLYGVVRLVILKRRLFLIGFGGLLAGAGIMIVLMGKDLSGISEEGTLFVHIEYESGDTVEICDERTALLADRLNRIPGVERVETNAKFGSAEMVVRFSSATIKRERLSGLVRAEGRRIPHSFVYVPESTSIFGKKIEVAITGDDNARLRELASLTAENLGKESWVEQVVLHYKEGPPMYVFSVDQERARTAGVSTSFLANGLRWALHGPVALKWIEDNHEIDLRLMSTKKNVSSLDALQRLTFKLPPRSESKQPTAVSLRQLGTFSLTHEESKIYRKNRQRAVFFTVHTRDMDLDAAAAALWERVSAIPLPEGYAYELDESAARLSEQFRLMWFVLALALALVYMILAAQSESFTSPLLISATVPLSLAVPVLVLFLTGSTLSTPLLIGLIILTGMAVNNALLIIDIIRSRVLATGAAFTREGVEGPILYSLRRRIRDLLLTSGTSVFGALPLLILQSGGEGILASLAFVVFWGIIGSLAVTLFFLPAVISTFPALLRSFEADRRSLPESVSLR